MEQNLSDKDMADYLRNLEKILHHLEDGRPYTWLYKKNNNLVYNNRVKNVKTSILSRFKYIVDFRLK